MTIGTRYLVQTDGVLHGDPLSVPLFSTATADVIQETDGRHCRYI